MASSTISSGTPSGLNILLCLPPFERLLFRVAGTLGAEALFGIHDIGDPWQFYLDVILHLSRLRLLGVPSRFQRNVLWMRPNKIFEWHPVLARDHLSVVKMDSLGST